MLFKDVMISSIFKSKGIKTEFGLLQWFIFHLGLKTKTRKDLSACEINIIKSGQVAG